MPFQITLKCSRRGSARSVLDWIKLLEIYADIHPRSLSVD